MGLEEAESTRRIITALVHSSVNCAWNKFFSLGFKAALRVLELLRCHLMSLKLEVQMRWREDGACLEGGKRVEIIQA